MRPVEFAPEAIIEAGQELRAAGRNITGFALRQKVGGGNPSRLKQVWDEYVASQSATKAEPVAELPIEVAEEVAAVTKALTERLATLAIELNDKAVKAAERRVHEVVRSAGEQRAQAERELADAAQTVDDLEAKLDEATAQGEALDTKLADVHATNQAQAVELAQLRERLAVTEQAAKADQVRHKQEADQLRSVLVEQKKATQTTATERDQVRSELASVKARAEAADQAHQDQRKAADQEAHRATARIAKAEADQVLARHDASTAREEAAKLRGQVEAMQMQSAELLRALTERQAQQTDGDKPTQE